jgi:hypothetical protein
MGYLDTQEGSKVRGKGKKLPKESEKAGMNGFV